MNVRNYGSRGQEFGKCMDDYEEELRAFSRKREWEREREKHKNRLSSSSEDEKSEVSGSHRRKKPRERTKKPERSAKIKEKSLEDTDGIIFCVQVCLTMFTLVGTHGISNHSPCY